MRSVTPLSVCFHNVWALHCKRALLKQHGNLGARAEIVFCSEVLHHPVATDRIVISIDENTNQMWEGELQSFRLIKEALGSSFTGVYHANQMSEYECRRTAMRYLGTQFGNAIFYRDHLAVLLMQSIPVFYGNRRIKPRTMQVMVVEHFGTRYVFGHLHGLWIMGNTKGDARERVVQSMNVKRILGEVADKFDTNKIVFGGDLNLDLDTEAMQILEEGGFPLRNLVREYGIANTRTPLYRKYGMEGESMYADYVLASETVTALQFRVHNDVLSSDHALLEVVIQ